MSATTIIAALRHRYIRIFREAGATHPGAAIYPADFGVRDSLVFRKLVRQGIFVETGNGRYYLNEEREVAMRGKRLSALLLLLAAIIVILVVQFLMRRQ